MKCWISVRSQWKLFIYFSENFFIYYLFISVKIKIFALFNIPWVSWDLKDCSLQIYVFNYLCPPHSIEHSTKCPALLPEIWSVSEAHDKWREKSPATVSKMVSNKFIFSILTAPPLAFVNYYTSILMTHYFTRKLLQSILPSKARMLF